MQTPIRVSAAVLAQAPRERYQAALAGQSMLPDETGEIVRRSLKQVEEMLTASNSPPAQEKRGQSAGTVITGKLTFPQRTEPAATDEDPFAKMLRELEPISKNRM